MTKTYYRSPLGWIEAAHQGAVLCSLGFVAQRPRHGTLLTGRLRRELKAYFEGRKGRFTVPMAEKGTIFQKRVWSALRAIPHGATRSYKEVARRIGCARSIRAVAGACARNPIMLLTPCHRVIGSDGRLAGYAFGLKKKSWLLGHEASG